MFGIFKKNSSANKATQASRKALWTGRGAMRKSVTMFKKRIRRDNKFK